MKVVDGETFTPKIIHIESSIHLELMIDTLKAALESVSVEFGGFHPRSEFIKNLITSLDE